MDDETTLLPCPFCGGEVELKEYKPNVSGVAICKECGARSPICKNDHTGGWKSKAIAVWNTRAELGNGTLTAEQVRKTVERHGNVMGPRFYGDWQAIADELNANLGSGSTKNLMLRVFGLAQMMYDCWLEECKAGDNVDISACNAYSYEFDQIAQAMFDMGIDPNGSDYYRSGELGNVTCEQVLSDCDDGLMPPFTAHCSACGAEWGFTPRYCHNCGAKVVGTRNERKVVKR